MGLALLGSILGGISCRPQIASLCKDALPGFGNKLASASIALEPWSEAERGIGRSPSSVLGLGPEHAQLVEKDLSSWRDWTKQTVRTLHYFMDDIEDPHASVVISGNKDQIRTLLVQLESDLVYFAGYLENQRFTDAQVHLSNAKKHVQAAQQLVCGDSKVALSH